MHAPIIPTAGLIHKGNDMAEIIAIVSICVTVVTSICIVSYKMGAHADRIKTLKETVCAQGKIIEEINEKTASNTGAILVINGSLEYIKKAIDEIKGDIGKLAGRRRGDDL